MSSGAPMPSARILHIEDLEPHRAVFRRWIKARLPGVEVHSAGSIGQAEELLAAGVYDAIVVDLGLGRESQGQGTFRRVAIASRGTPILIHTGSEIDEPTERLLTGVSAGYFPKGGGEMPPLLDRLKAILGSPQSRLSERQLAEVLALLDDATARLDRALCRLEAGVANGD